MPEIDWKGMFSPGVPVAEIVLRGSIVYLSLFVLLRVVLKRQSGNVGLADLLVIVLIADAAQNAMSKDYQSITDGIVLVATIICWSYALEWAGHRFPAIQRFISPPALPLVRDGRMLRRNMRQELLTEDDLMSQLRLQGVDDLACVKLACMESDGEVSVITREPPEPEKARGAPREAAGV